jgi:uncharacterized protein
MDLPSTSKTQDMPPPKVISCPGVRHGLFALGMACTALGVAGLVLPVLPGTVFFLVALWAFSRSSPRFHGWLYHHPRLGAPLRQWHAHRAIPLRAKITAVSTMAVSLLLVILYVAEDWVLPSVLGAVMAVVATYIVTRPHRVLAPARQGTEPLVQKG